MKQNPFNIYIKDRDTSSFFKYTQSFIFWIKHTNLLPQPLTNFSHVFSEDKFELLGAKQLGKDFQKKNSYFYQDIENGEYNSILYKRYKHLLPKERIEEIERYFWWGFIETMFPQLNAYLGEKKESSIIEVKNKFNDFLVNRIPIEDNKAFFLRGFEYFLENIPLQNKEKCAYGYVWIENIGFGQKDIGLVLFNKTNLSSEILFFQIIDNEHDKNNAKRLTRQPPKTKKVSS